MSHMLSIGQMTSTDFIMLTSMKKEQFSGVVRGMSLPKALEFRRNMQIAMTAHRRNFPNDQFRMERALVLCATIEKWCRNIYFPFQMKKTAREHPAWERQTVKIEVKRQWEQLVRQSSY